MTKTAPGRKRPQDENGPRTKTALAVICYIVSLLTSKNSVPDASKCSFKQKHPFKGFKFSFKKTALTSNNKVTDVPKCLLRQKQAFKGFKFSFKKNGPDFKIGHTDLDDLKNLTYGCAQVFTQAKTDRKSVV